MSLFSIGLSSFLFSILFSLFSFFNPIKLEIDITSFFSSFSILVSFLELLISELINDVVFLGVSCLTILSSLSIFFEISFFSAIFDFSGSGLVSLGAPNNDFPSTLLLFNLPKSPNKLRDLLLSFLSSLVFVLVFIILFFSSFLFYSVIFELNKLLLFSVLFSDGLNPNNPVSVFFSLISNKL